MEVVRSARLLVEQGAAVTHWLDSMSRTLNSFSFVTHDHDTI